MLNKLLSPSTFLSQMSVRFNCPWHRSNFRPFYFPFNMKHRVTVHSIDGLMKKPGSRVIAMKRILKEKPFIGWRHDVKTPERRLSYPL